MPGNGYRASTYATIEPSSIVSTTPPVTTRTVLKNRSPMRPVVHALEKFSQWNPVGRLSGSREICASVLNDDATAHSSGSTTIAPHSSRKPCEKKLRTPAPRSPSPPRRRRADRGAPVVTAGAGGGVEGGGLRGPQYS